jgi:ribonuclease HI
MKVYTYGGCTNNYQHDIQKREMYIVFTDDSGNVLVEKTRRSGSNNLAELWAIEEALLYARSCGIVELDLYSDSKTALSWLNGRIGKKLNDRRAVLELLESINEVRQQHVRLTTNWVPRDHNLAAVYIDSLMEKSAK